MLLDFMLPGINGMQVANISKRTIPYVKVVIITGRPDAARDLSKDSVLVDVLTKL